jgi:acyl carrier protein
MDDIENKLAAMLVPVLGANSSDEIRPELSLVDDLGAESLDFVEITYLVKKEFKVELKVGAIVSGAASANPEELFIDGALTEAGAETISQKLPSGAKRFTAGMTKADIFSALTVADLATIIRMKLEEKGKENV